MSRARLDARSKTVLKQFKLPSSLARDFAARCRELGYSQSDMLRTLAERWLRQTAAMARLKGKHK